MSEYRSNTTIEEMAERIGSARSVLLTTHTKPDGDGLGAVLALSRALVAMPGGRRRADIYLMGPVEPRLEAIAGDTPYTLVGDRLPGDEYDLVVIADTGSWSQLQPLAAWLRTRREIIVGLDHHAAGDDVASLRIVDPTAASTTQVLLPLLQAMGCEITGGEGGVAEALFVGLATDTGWFRFSSAGPAALRQAAWLLDRGVDKTRLYQLIEETFRPQRLALAARALASLHYALDGTVAIMSLSPEDFVETAGTLEDLSELVNAPMSVRVVRASILLAEVEPSRTKVSFRSKPAPAGHDVGSIDMNLLAQRFGGGGHVHAAGAQIPMPAARAREAVEAALEGLLCHAEGSSVSPLSSRLPLPSSARASGSGSQATDRTPRTRR